MGSKQSRRFIAEVEGHTETSAIYDRVSSSVPAMNLWLLSKFIIRTVEQLCCIDIIQIH